MQTEVCNMTPDAVHHPLRRTTRLESLDVPREALNVHLWIVAGVPADIIHQLAALVETDVGVICKLTGISRSTVTRRLKADTALSISQGARVYGVVLALDAALSLQEDDALRALSWLHRPARGLGGVAPATLLTTQMGVQAVIDLVGRIQHGVCI
ncbi:MULTISPECIES: antitoxin Xre/MbcA/ParS toxin-binding domain-containing protein [Aeromonas]|uniref:Antitoxin Xre/MbcA/ParS toxin-binding domain-containing protein n=2 Tax=Aeromonadaceae TaxID=84642 RepID=A0AAW9EZM9_AERCA|nr:MULTISPECIES: antitoxin Xre/MbcA/ParS toxin-binding domain-containing protein [Aeromonas]MDX7677212.1 antitoxin Xre/MbcA/ParS toxin-binding domain-containing protein [Aeromonas caviae]MDX7700568.1 antitoxin Xre/MbcA/ParS toxin-binding domain-containing protein [Aeromonas caviae]MDX7720485.1 antitoxin Xre/MbcA/ParS toxin-binding domain-containing protein [Aeromonas caviae]MDX7750848.1 antitoxin Xre/MbcA/ParS toxin-binding domain-containing protein [Aeromonas caviae]MDX7802178.1 antitoxin Xre